MEFLYYQYFTKMLILYMVVKDDVKYTFYRSELDVMMINKIRKITSYL